MHKKFLMLEIYIFFDMFQSNFNKISILMEIEGNLYGRRPDSIF